MMKELLCVALTSLFSIVALFFLTRLMGHKQVSQLNIFDYIVGITVGSIAAELATELESPERPFVAMVIYCGAALAISFISMKSTAARRFLTSSPAVLMKGGVIYRGALKRARLNINDLIAQARCQGYFDLADIKIAVLEENGKISFLQKDDKAPVTACDMGLSAEKKTLGYDVVMDGKIMADNLRGCGRNETWLRAELKKQGFKSEKGIALAVFDGEEALAVFALEE